MYVCMSSRIFLASELCILEMGLASDNDSWMFESCILIGWNGSFEWTSCWIATPNSRKASPKSMHRWASSCWHSIIESRTRVPAAKGKETLVRDGRRYGMESKAGVGEAFR